MITEIKFLVMGIIAGYFLAEFIDGLIYKIIHRERENLRDWWTYKWLPKHKDK